VKFIVESCHSKPDYDTAKHTHLQRLDSADRRNCSSKHILRNGPIPKDIPLKHEHRIDGYMHNKKGNHCRQSSHFFFFFCHSNGNSHRKNERQIIKNNASCLAHDRKQCVKYSTFPENRLKSVCLDHG